MFLWITVVFIIIIIFLFVKLCYFITQQHKWIVPYIRNGNSRQFSETDFPIHVYFSICDHFQPFAGFVSQEIAEHRVVTWQKEYTLCAQKHSDSHGNHPVHTFFYSEEDYNPHFTDELSKMVRDKIADVELMIPHQNETIPNIKRKIEEFRDVLFHHHGLLRKNNSGKIVYGFIHEYRAKKNNDKSNWFTNTSKRLSLLKETGCYADYSFPSDTNTIVPPVLNSIYFANVNSNEFHTNPTNYSAAKNVWSEKDLLFIQGSLFLNWNKRFWGMTPKIENGSLSHLNHFTPDRADLWVKKGIHINGIKNHIFIKLFTHGAIDHTIRYFFGENGLEQLWSYMEKNYINDKYELHYVSAFNMYEIIRELCTNATIGSDKKTI